MQKNTQLKLLVFIFFVIILGLWFYVNGKLDRFNFSFGSDVASLKSQINQSISNIKLDSKASSLRTSIEAAKDLLKQEISTTTETTTSANDISGDIVKDVAEDVIEKINNSTTTASTPVNYKYDPWKIEFVYPSGAKKIIDEKNQIISLTYGENYSAYIYYKELKEKSFGEWLAKNFNLEDLNKEIINDSTFWLRTYEGSGFKSRAYYTNYNKSIFIITINYKQAIDEDGLMGIVNSFKIIK